ncbi:alcohol dehydrogenase [Moesziomyces antarcticus]|uniref:Related to alcohol dehydrogenase n=1 Tax=Pseudozyma antarctica TaxID=84753 RepID=A0A5C3FJJ3_PSEA2|nr:alcohol dehydrogenase [Moesziomyces antarcticus]GAK63767.1 alcohol dehydrogenase [Moesziomyces antarcticus]SPO44370.1 related to alcohol dehydrogenase [Moesziomyces antarcticus]
MVTNHQVLFNKEQPTGLPKPGVTTKPSSVELDIDNVPLNGGVLTRNIAVSLDPTMRNRMKGDIGYFTPAYEVGKPVTAIGIAEVVRSEVDSLAAGDVVFVWSLGIEEYTIHSADAAKMFRKFDAAHLNNGLSITTYLGAAGMAGMTAYMSIKEIIGDLKPGNKMFVSGAAGAVGQLVTQIAHQAGVKVIASAGSDEKCDFVRSLGADETINYKTEDLPAKLKAFAADTGIHYYYDNVGGDQLEAYINVAARYGIIVACGYISGYNVDKPEDVVYPKNLFNIVTKELKYQGFIVSSFIPKWLGQFMKEIPQMLAEGKIKNREDVTFGVYGAEDAFLRLFTGDNNGKVAVLIDTERAEKWNLGKQKQSAKIWN